MKKIRAQIRACCEWLGWWNGYYAMAGILVFIGTAVWSEIADPERRDTLTLSTQHGIVTEVRGGIGLGPLGFIPDHDCGATVQVDGKPQSTGWSDPWDCDLYQVGEQVVAEQRGTVGRRSHRIYDSWFEYRKS